MREELSTYDNLKAHLDTLVNTNATLDSLGINADDFMYEARTNILQRVKDIAAERLENNTE